MCLRFKTLKSILSTTANILQTMHHKQTWHISGQLALLILTLPRHDYVVSGELLFFKGEKHISPCLWNDKW